MTGLELDHALILHDDLDGAGAAARRLGFRPTPTGYHGQGLGTANATIMMPDRQTYFELIAVTEPTPRNADKRAALDARGPHLLGTAFKGDARAARADFAALGVAEGEAFDFVRQVDLPSGPREARFAIAQIAAGTLPGLYSFVCEHFTPDVVWREDYLEHPNGARAVSGLWGVAPDPGALAEAWRPLFGNRVALRDGVLEIDAGAGRFRYLAPAAWSEMFGETPSGPGPHLRALEIAVTSASALEDLLSAGRVDWERRASRIAVPDRIGFGCTVLFRQA